MSEDGIRTGVFMTDGAGLLTVWDTSSMALAALTAEPRGYCLGSRTSHWSWRDSARCSLVVHNESRAARSRYISATVDDGAVVEEDMEASYTEEQ